MTESGIKGQELASLQASVEKDKKGIQVQNINFDLISESNLFEGYMKLNEDCKEIIE